MISEDLEALALADSVGALDPNERLELKARLAELAPEERARIASLYETAIEVAAGAEVLEPPAHVRDRVLAAARTPTRYTVPSGDTDWAETGLPGIRSKVLAVDTVRVARHAADSR